MIVEMKRGDYSFPEGEDLATLERHDPDFSHALNKAKT